jgi:septum site-determining protein MinD
MSVPEGFISSKSKRAEEGRDPVNQMLLINRYDPARAEAEEMLQLKDIQELLGLNLIGVVPESKAVSLFVCGSQ